jgi:hypothetical protein
MPPLQPRSPFLLIRTLALPVLGFALATLVGCGGGGGGSAATPTPPPSWLVGAWTGTGAYDASPYYALILPTGSTRIVSSGSNAQYSGTLAVKGTAVSGSGTIYLPDGVQTSTGANQAAGTLGGTASQSPARLTLTATMEGETSAINLTPDPAYTPNVQLASLAGTYQSDSATNSLQTSVTLTLDSGGNMSGSVTGGSLDNAVLSGSVAPVTPGQNAFSVNVTVTPPPGGGASFTSTGLAYYRQAVTGTNPTAAGLFVATSSAQGPFSGIFSLATNANGTPSTLAGVWAGSFTSAGSATPQTFLAAILRDGTIWATSTAASGVAFLASGTVGLTSNTVSSGSMSVFTSLSGPASNGTLSGTLTGYQINGSLSANTPGGLSGDLQLNKGQSVPLPLGSFAGITYSGNVYSGSSETAVTLTLNADGSFTGASPAGASLTGQLEADAQPPATASSTALLNLTITPSGGTSASFSGAAIVLRGTSNHLILMATAADGEGLLGIFND